jgi:hypothetical protein
MTGCARRKAADTFRVAGQDCCAIAATTAFGGFKVISDHPFQKK